MAYEVGQKISEVTVTAKLPGLKLRLQCKYGHEFETYMGSIGKAVAHGRPVQCPACQKTIQDEQRAERKAEMSGKIYHPPSRWPLWQYVPKEPLEPLED